MRITLVSAHYPPNFVSGGTLQPQRLAHGLRDRGHDVRCSPAASTPRRRSTPGPRTTRPACRCTGSSPAVDRLGRRAQLRQPGGGRALRGAPRASTPPTSCTSTRSRRSASGLVEVAKAPGAATVVDDARLLVGLRPPVPRRPRPPPVLPRRRGRRLRLRGRAAAPRPPRRRLRDAARPRRPGARARRARRPGARAPTASPPAASRSTRTGMPSCRRPVAARAAAPRRRTARSSVRYTGGQQPDEGRRRAPRRRPPARPPPGLRIVAHDLDDAVERDGRSARAAPRSSARPPYEPDELDEVLADHRRARAARRSCASRTRSSPARRCCAGVPVIATDTLGPEEVVDHGVNGLIVPPPTPTCWPPRSRSLVDPPTARATCDEGAAAPPRRPALDDQVAGLERALPSAVAVRAVGRAPAADGAPDACVLFVVGHRRRAAALPRPPAGRGARPPRRAHRRPPLPRPGRARTSAAEADVVVVYRVPATAAGPRAHRRACASAGTPVRVRRRRPHLRPRPRRRDPRPAPAPARRGGALARGRAPLPHRRWRPATPTSARRRRSSSTPDAWSGIDATCSRTASAWRSARPATSPCAGRARPAAAGRLLQRHHHPRRRLAPRRARGGRGPRRPPGRRALARRPPAPTRRGPRPARRPGAPAPVHRLAPTCPACSATSTSTSPRSSRAAASTTPRAPSSGSRRPSSPTPTIASPSAPFRDAIDTAAPAGSPTTRRSWATCSSVPSRTPTSARRSAPGPGARRCCGGHRTCRAPATWRSWSRCAPTRATVGHP